ncbi:MAG: hypothetical protein GF381_03890 [Candidatus Pacebacteria bacterium]|nr:hypothetical protein [Candidatus Paceibacterota bacterium]
MKNKSVIIFIILIVGLGLSILFWEFNNWQGQEEVGPSPTQPPAAEQALTPTQETEAATDSAATDEELEAIPTVSQETDLETIDQELEETQILEEDFSNL